MKKSRRGFTLIEISIFLAVTGALFAVVTIGVQNSIFQQRYNDAVQNYAEFLRSVYSETTNVQSPYDGKSDQAIYGKLVTFGESVNLAGDLNDDQALFVYDIIGKSNGDIGGGNIVNALKNLEATVVVARDGKVVPAGMVESYIPRWGAKLQKTGNLSHPRQYEGSLLIVRHPRSGMVYTLASDLVLEVNQAVKNAQSYFDIEDALDKANVLTSEALDSFEMKQVDFCVNPYGDDPSRLRTDVRIIDGSRNASGIEIRAEDNNVCRSDD